MFRFIILNVRHTARSIDCSIALSSIPLVAVPANEQSADSGTMNMSDGRSCVTPSSTKSRRLHAELTVTIHISGTSVLSRPRLLTSLADDEADGFANLDAILPRRVFAQVSPVCI